MVAVAPEHLTVVDSFFLCAANIVIAAIPGATTINGLIISDNQFDGCNNDSVIIDERLAAFTAVYDTYITDNLLTSGYNLKGVEAFAQLTLSQATEWTFDFSDQLLFPTITSVEYSVQFSSGLLSLVFVVS